MIRFLRAFAWLRWRILINGLRGGRARDTMERFSRVAAVVTPALMVLLFAAFSLGFALLAFFAGLWIGSDELDPASSLLVARLFLFVFMLLPLLIPLGQSSQGSLSAHPRFRLLPVRRGVLHGVEVAAGLVDPWTGFVIPALIMLPVGMLRSGRVTMSALALAASLSMLLMLACFTALLTFLMQWLLRDRRRAEVMTLVFMLAVIGGGFLPGFFADRLRGEDRDAQGGRDDRSGRGRVTINVRGLDERLPAWTAAVPSELYGRSVLAAAEGRPASSLAATAAILAEAALFFMLSSAVHQRLLDAPDSGGPYRRAGRGRAAAGRPVRIGWLGPAASAVAAVQVRTALRTVRGKLSVFVPGPSVLVIGLTMKMRGEELPAVPAGGAMALAGGLAIALLSLQPFLLNQFASDRAGLTLQFLAPIPDRELVAGKMAGGLILLGLSGALCLVTSLILSPGGSIWRWGSSLAGCLSAYLILAPVAAMLSAVFPRSSDLSKVGREGNAHGAAVLIGSLVTLASLALPAVMLLVLDVLVGMPAAAFWVVTLWALLCAIASRLLLTAAAGLLPDRRENLALVAQGR